MIKYGNWKRFNKSESQESEAMPITSASQLLVHKYKGVAWNLSNL